MEIERKWIVPGWPKDLKYTVQSFRETSYISVNPPVRIMDLGNEYLGRRYVLTFKNRQTAMSSDELHITIDGEQFEVIKRTVGLNPINREFRVYMLDNGVEIQVKHVDAGTPNEFFYAEIEFNTEADAMTFNEQELANQFSWVTEVTGVPEYRMEHYWERTRGIV